MADDQHCNFCGKLTSEVPLMITGQEASICFDCIVLSAAVVSLKDGTVDEQFDRALLAERDRLMAAFAANEAGPGDEL